METVTQPSITKETLLELTPNELIPQPNDITLKNILDYAQTSVNDKPKIEVIPRHKIIYDLIFINDKPHFVFSNIIYNEKRIPVGTSINNNHILFKEVTQKIKEINKQINDWNGTPTKTMK